MRLDNHSALVEGEVIGLRLHVVKESARNSCARQRSDLSLPVGAISLALSDELRDYVPSKFLAAKYALAV